MMTNIQGCPLTSVCVDWCVSACIPTETCAHHNSGFKTWHSGQKKKKKLFHFLLLSKQKTSWFWFCCFKIGWAGLKLTMYIARLNFCFSCPHLSQVLCVFTHSRKALPKLIYIPSPMELFFPFQPGVVGLVLKDPKGKWSSWSSFFQCPFYS